MGEEPVFLDGVYADPDNTGTPEFFPSIGEDCRTRFPIRSEFFNPGVCPRTGQAASS